MHKLTIKLAQLLQKHFDINDVPNEITDCLDEIDKNLRPKTAKGRSAI